MIQRRLSMINCSQPRIIIIIVVSQQMVEIELQICFYCISRKQNMLCV